MKFSREALGLLSLCLFLVTSCAGTRSRALTEKIDTLSILHQSIENILQDSSLYQTRTGIKVVSLETGRVLYARDSQLLFHPASNMKLLTTATALKKLGTDFKFKTILYADSVSVADSLVVGNLYLKGFANPDLTSEDLWWMVQKLKELGINKITGNLICDESYLDDWYLGHGWMWDDASAWYYALISALTVNDNCVKIKVMPGTQVGDTLRYVLDPPTSYVTIENQGVTVDSSDTTQIKAFKVERKWRERENTIVIQGGLPASHTSEEFVIEILDPALYTGTLFTELLRKENIKFSGKVVKGVTPDSLKILVEHQSLPITAAIMNTNKISDNLSAELLLKTVGAETFGPPGTAEKGLKAIKQFLFSIGVDTTSFELADGSGLSRYNVISPDHIIELLKAMYEDFRVRSEFLASLPIAGVDGTLEDRMQGTPAEGKLRAKTGSLRGVSTLSGYTTTADGEPLAFSIMMEHFVVPTERIRAVQDRIGALLSGFKHVHIKATTDHIN